MTPIYHITHLDNLPAILEQGGLWCDRESAQRGLLKVGIAHAHIKERRARRKVPVAAGGTLADYVPFYFAPRSPMLYAVHRGQVVDYRGGQSAVVHLVATAESVAASETPFGFTDGHADMALSRFFSDLADLKNVDWKMMRETYWNDTEADGDRKRRRQAEFLMHRFFPWPLVTEIGVINKAVAEKVTHALGKASHQPVVSVKSGWYY